MTVVDLPQETLDAMDKWQKEEFYPVLNEMYVKAVELFKELGVPRNQITPMLINEFIGYGLNLLMTNLPSLNKESTLDDVSFVYDRVKTLFDAHNMKRSLQ